MSDRPAGGPDEDEIERAAKGMYEGGRHSTHKRWEHVAEHDKWLASAYRKKARDALTAARGSDSDDE